MLFYLFVALLFVVVVLFFVSFKMLRFLFVLSALAQRMRRVALTLHTNVHFDQVFTDK